MILRSVLEMEWSEMDGLWQIDHRHGDTFQ